MQRALLIAHWIDHGRVPAARWSCSASQLTLLNVQRPMGDTEISYAYVTAAVPVGSLLMVITALRQLVGYLRDHGLTFGGGESPL